MSDNKTSQSNEDSPPGIGRRDMLKTIGTALAAASVAPMAIPQLGAATTAPRVIRIDPSVKLPLPNSGDLSVFFSLPKNGDTASVVVVHRDDTATVKRLERDLGGSPASARLVNGVVQVNIGRAAAGRCFINSAQAVARFKPSDAVTMGPILRN